MSEDVDFSAVYIDITALNAVEAHLRRSPGDPWNEKILHDLVNVCAYAEEVRLIVPRVFKNSDLRSVPLPQIARDLLDSDDFALSLAPAELYDAEPVDPDQTVSRIEDFRAWVAIGTRRKTVQQWLDLHQNEWLTAQHRERVGSLLTGFGSLPSDIKTALRESADSVEIQVKQFAYAFDVVQRFEIYNEVAGNQIYVPHPLRDGFHGAMPVSSELNSGYPVSFAGWISIEGKNLNRRDFLSRLAHFRKVSKRWQLANRTLDHFTKNERRDLALELQLPASLKPWPHMLLENPGLEAVTSLGTAIATGSIPAGFLVGAGSFALKVELKKWSSRIPGKLASSKAFRSVVHWPDIEGTNSKS